MLASPLALALAANALALAIFAQVASLAGDPLAGRIAGLCGLTLAVRALRLAPRTATGSRRAVARVAAALSALIGALHLAGPSVIARLDTLAPAALGSPAREQWSAVIVAVASAWVWGTSPAVRG